MENEEVGKMLERIYGRLAYMPNGHLKEFKEELFSFYVELDNVNDQAETANAILHFVERAYKNVYFSEDYAEDILKEFYQLAYYKGEAPKLISWFKYSKPKLRNKATIAFKEAQEEIDDCVKDIIVAKNRKKEYLKKYFASDELKKYADLIQNFSKNEDDNLHLLELKKFAENFKEVQESVNVYDTDIYDAKTKLYNMMTNSESGCVGSIGDFGSFLEKEIARVSAEDKTLTNPDGQGK